MSMQNGKGTMAAVLGLTEDVLEKYLVPSVVMANLNSKTQIVISGTNEGIDAVIEALNDKILAEVVKVRKLSVSAAFHSPQMVEVEAIMRKEIENITMNKPNCYIVSNVTGKPTNNIDEIKANLISQVTGQVRWYDSINALVNEKIDQFYECGYGKVLRKMNKTIVLSPKCMSI